MRELAHSFNDTAAKLESLLHSQEQFVADASHELRTPLTALRLRLENLERDTPASGRTDVEAAIAEAERLNGMVEDLLALARADATEAQAEPVDLAELVRSRAEAWEAYADERGVRVVAETTGKPIARVARGRVEQIVDNLLSNALEVSPPGSAVRLVAEPGPAGMQLRIVDQGPGMTAVERGRAFDRFWRGKHDGSGSGLGLAIVKRLAEADDGDGRAPRGRGRRDRRGRDAPAGSLVLREQEHLEGRKRAGRRVEEPVRAGGKPFPQVSCASYASSARPASRAARRSGPKSTSAVRSCDPGASSGPTPGMPPTKVRTGSRPECASAPSPP